MRLIWKHPVVSLLVSWALSGGLSAQAQNWNMTPELSRYKGVTGSTVTVKTGCITPGKHPVEHYDVLVDGKVAASSPSNPPAHECSFDAGFGIPVNSLQVSYDPLSIKMDLPLGAHSVAITYHYSDGSVENGGATTFTVVPPNPAANQVLTPIPSPVASSATQALNTPSAVALSPDHGPSGTLVQVSACGTVNPSEPFAIKIDGSVSVSNLPVVNCGPGKLGFGAGTTLPPISINVTGNPGPHTIEVTNFGSATFTLNASGARPGFNVPLRRPRAEM
ncbi:MAG: hypothetical protein C5B53_12290 [Candidatus Melainabacteria bacterium]|nr:MAG: hypothetical protein C5B53_12290 [Candidatus Melainabacteria bacterium]